MNLEIKNFNSIEIDKQYEIATNIEDYTNGKTNEQPQMLPVTTEEVFKKYLGFVAFKENDFAGYISSNIPEEWNGNKMSEVGSLWVPYKHAKQGIAHFLVENCTKELDDLGIVPFAFCNSLSLNIFKDNNYKESLEECIPESTFNLCIKCPVKPDNGCCDTVVVWDGPK